MPPSAKPWKQYGIGEASAKPGWVNTNCQKCIEVSHVSHIEPALKITSDGKISKGLVFDESILNTERILVSWLSPNIWAYGFRYGNVRFTYDFAKLVENKKFYWVEAITRYSPTACRILITSEDRSSLLTRYDPAVGDGPWWHDTTNDTHYFNGDFCLEFMLEDDLLMSRAARVDFVQHHANYCSVHRASPKSCSELGLHQDKAGARFLSMASGRGVSLERLNGSLIEEDGKLSDRITSALAWVMVKLQNIEYSNHVKASSEQGLAVARAILNALAIEQKDEAKLLASLFRSETALVKAISIVIADSIGWDDIDAVRAAMNEV